MSDEPTPSEDFDTKTPGAENVGSDAAAGKGEANETQTTASDATPETVAPDAAAEETVVGGSRDGKNQGDANPEIAEQKRAEPSNTTPKGDADVVVATKEGGAPHVTQHLDKDLNDPRNLPPTPQLPSLNDPGQS